MSLALQARMTALEARVEKLESKLAAATESLAYLHGKVLGGKDATLPEKVSATVRNLMGKGGG
jgi:uncharacterized coiled-coil protein SlyX